MPETPRAISPSQGGYWRHTIEALDDLIDRTERHRRLLHQSKHTGPASRLGEALDIITEVRNDLICKQYEADRKRIPDA